MAFPGSAPNSDVESGKEQLRGGLKDDRQTIATYDDEHVLESSVEIPVLLRFSSASSGASAEGISPFLMTAEAASHQFTSSPCTICYTESMENDGDVTRILSAINDGKADASSLLPLVYSELRHLAAARLKQESPGQTLQPTALVHEAYMRLVGDAATAWDSRGHFFGAAAEAMRRILIENARRKKRIRHGGRHNRVELNDGDPALSAADIRLLALDEALTELAKESAEKAELIKLRYFAGLSEQDAAEILGISRATAARWWVYSKAWLSERMS